MRKTIVCTSLVLLSACAVQQSPPVAITEPTPICTNDRQCEAMWAEAPNAIEMATGMRVRMQSDTLIDTYVPINHPRAQGRVTKRPQPQGGYAIVAELSCRSEYVCSRIRNSGINVFNMMVTIAGGPFADAQEP